MRMVDKAIEFAAEAHAGDVRKGTNTPYFTHPFAVGLLLAEAGCSEAVVCAGILHDTVEDTPVELEDLVREFGEQVAVLVAGASEPDKTKSWRERKEHTHAYLQTAPREICLVSCADKLHNLRCLKRDLEVEGETVFDKFNAKRDAQKWYYEGVVQALADTLAGHALYDQLKQEVQTVFG